MRYRLYCDESRIQDARHMLIGGLWVLDEAEAALRQCLQDVRSEYRMTAEFKWTKVSRAKRAAYAAWVDAFLDSPGVTFRCIVVDTHVLDYKTFHRGDEELGFYKFYYLLVSRNLMPAHSYWLYTDERRNRKANRLEVLRIVTNRYWQKQAGVMPLRGIEPRRSHGEDLLQLTDVLLGAVGYAWNGLDTSPAKRELGAHLAARLGWATLRTATRRDASKVNQWLWRPSAQSEAKRKRPRS